MICFHWSLALLGLAAVVAWGCVGAARLMKWIAREEGAA